MALNAVEKQCLEEFLEMARLAMSRAGCNDFEIPNTAEAWSLIEQAEADNLGITVEEWRKHEDYRKRPKGKTIITYDFLVFGYLRKKVVQLCS